MNSKTGGEIWNTVFGWVGAAILTLVGLMLTIAGSYELSQGRKTRSWLETSGRILESDIVSRSSTSRRSTDTSRTISQTDTDYDVELRYSYTVGNGAFEGRRVQYGNTSHDERAAAQEELARYPRGTDVPVYYDPQDPARSVLVKGTGTSGLGLGLGATALVLGLGTMVYLLRRKSGRTPSAEAG